MVQVRYQFFIVGGQFTIFLVIHQAKDNIVNTWHVFESGLWFELHMVKKKQTDVTELIVYAVPPFCH